jgi:hypothetical protein
VGEIPISHHAEISNILNRSNPMSYLTMTQWAEVNTAAALDFWLRDSGGLVNGGEYVRFMLPPLLGYAAMPAPILRRSTMYARADGVANIAMTGLYTPSVDRPGGYAFDLTAQGTGSRTMLATLEVNAWCGRLMHDRLGNPLPVEASHLALLTYLRQFRDTCINDGANLIFTTDQGYTEEAYYIHQYSESIMPWSYPDRDWVVHLTMIGVGDVTA